MIPKPEADKMQLVGCEVESLKKKLVSYLGITLGSVFMALSIVLFIKSNRIVPGGIMGIVNIIYYYTGFSAGITNFCISIPIFAIGILTLGKKVGIKTFYCNLVYSFILEILDRTLMPMTQDYFLATVFGGALMGLGVGTILGFGGTFGGTDLIARIIHKYVPVIPTQWIMFCVDSLVIVGGGIAFGPEIALFSIVTIFIMTKVVDVIQEGVNYGKALFIISEKSEEIAEAILNEVDRGVTSLDGKGMYTRKEKNVLYCVVKRSQVVAVKNMVLRMDPKAFITIGDVREVVGKGFEDSLFS
ncbi:MAG: YitT family protein [Bacillota bacterium]